VDADQIREVAKLWGEAGAAVVYWGMGISQHTTGTDNARCLIALCSITGQSGAPAPACNPLRGQNNVQGASDAGLIPMFYPDYQGVDRDATQRLFEQAWGTPLNPNRGLTVTEIIKSVLQPDGVRGMYMLGRNPFLSDPNINKVRKALSTLDFLVVQDIFLTETAEFADVILPATSYLRRTAPTPTPTAGWQLGRKVMDPPGQARPDWRIVQDIARRIGLDWTYESPSEVFDEMVALMPSYQNLTYDNLGLSGKLYPERRSRAHRRHDRDVRREVQHRRRARPPGARPVAAAQGAAGRGLPAGAQHRAVAGALGTPGSMTRRSFALDAISPDRRGLHAIPRTPPTAAWPHGEIGARPLAAGVDRVQVRISHREQLGNCFHPVPLPGGGGQPADHRRGRPVRQDP